MSLVILRLITCGPQKLVSPTEAGHAYPLLHVQSYRKPTYSPLHYLHKVVREEARLPIEGPLHPSLLLHLPDIPDDVSGVESQLVVMEGTVIVLHHNVHCGGREDDVRKQRQYSWLNPEVRQLL